jgi:hypothetical protein
MINKNSTLIFIDWDDTFFPTSWIFNKEKELLDPKIREEYSKILKDLDLLIYRFLLKLSQYGKIIIITNALLEWVNLSGSLLKNTHEIINKLPIPIVSAKQNYKNTTSNIKLWKTLCFDATVKYYATQKKISNIISIGDAVYEYDALVNLHKHHDSKQDRYLKAIQLTRNPTYNKLYEQIHIMYNCIDKICLHKNHLDIMFDQK